MNIVEVMADPNLFGREFGSPSWDFWRSLLGGFYGVDGIDAEKFTELTRREPGGPWNELWMAIGRRGGKSRSAALIAVYEAAFRDHRAKLAPGEVATVMVVAGDRRQARVVHGYIRGLLTSNAMLRKLVRRENAELIELSNGTAIEIGTASFRAIRGYTVSLRCSRRDRLLAGRWGEPRRRSAGRDSARLGDAERQARRHLVALCAARCALERLPQALWRRGSSHPCGEGNDPENESSDRSRDRRRGA